MKKIGVSFLLLLLLASFVFADPQIDNAEEDVEAIQDVIDSIPIGDDGKIDVDDYTPIKSKAEEKIDEINIWLEENASWLKAVFGMVPSLTLLFFVNFYIILFLLVNLVFNANAVFGLLPGMDKKIGDSMNLTLAHALGAVIFLILHVTKAIMKLAVVVATQLSYHWHKTWEVATPLAFIVMILIVIGFVLLIIFCPQFLQAVVKAREAKKAAKDRGEVARLKDSLTIMVDEATRVK